jgi:hypothetical protein
MTKAKSKSGKSTVKATAVKGSVRKSSIAPATSTPPLIVLGFDEQQKPRGAKFVDAKRDLVTKAADVMGLKVYEASPPEVAELAKKLPSGRLYANGRGFVPNIRQSLYSDLVVALGLEPQAALSKNGDKDGLPPARGLPQSWDDNFHRSSRPSRSSGRRPLCVGTGPASGDIGGGNPAPLEVARKSTRTCAG